MPHGPLWAYSLRRSPTTGPTSEPTDSAERLPARVDAYTPQVPLPRRGWEGWYGPHPRIDQAAPPREPSLPRSSRILRLGRALLRDVAIIAVLFLSFYLTVKSYEVDGSSMQPTLSDSEVLLVNKLVYARYSWPLLEWVPVVGDRLSEGSFVFHGPRRGDIVVFHDPRGGAEQIVKRVIGLPGERVEIVDGYVFIDGRRLEEPYIAVPWFESRPPVDIELGFYYVLGDNRLASLDSRGLGPIPIESIVGKASFTYWPISKLGPKTNIVFGTSGPELAADDGPAMD